MLGGWWSRECTVIGIDGSTGLLLAVYHVMRGVNFDGSSKGKLSFYLFSQQWRDLEFKK